MRYFLNKLYDNHPTIVSLPFYPWARLELIVFLAICKLDALYPRLSAHTQPVTVFSESCDEKHPMHKTSYLLQKPRGSCPYEDF